MVYHSSTRTVSWETVLFPGINVKHSSSNSSTGIIQERKAVRRCWYSSSSSSPAVAGRWRQVPRAHHPPSVTCLCFLRVSGVLWIGSGTRSHSACAGTLFFFLLFFSTLVPIAATAVAALQAATTTMLPIFLRLPLSSVRGGTA